MSQNASFSLEHGKMHAPDTAQSAEAHFSVALKDLLHTSPQPDIQARKDTDSATSEKKPTAPRQPDRSSGYRSVTNPGTYLFGDPYSDPAYYNRGDPDAPPPNWTSYTGNRILVRLFSRGLMGATFYTMAHRWIPGQLRGYMPTGAIDAGKPMQYLARGFDLSFGAPIKFFTNNFYLLRGRGAEEAATLAENAVWFRPKNMNYGTPMGGRSLGAEIVGMTGDFAAGSVGDAWGRQIANMADPNYTNGWRDNAGKVHPWFDENGHFQTKDFLVSVRNQTWKIFSQNQGEDWAAALPYVYQMRFQRVALGKLYPGFRYSSDYQLNGASWRINEHGHIIDSYAKAGALDLQARFTGYNWYTLMYRDLYDHIGDRINNYKVKGTFADPNIEHRETGERDWLEAAAHAFKYVTKSAIKATIYMTPAVPFFWITRTPQSKPHGLGILVDSQSGEISPQLQHVPFAHENPFDARNTRGVFDRMTNPFGKACFEGSKALNQAFEAMKVPLRTQYEYRNPTFAETWMNASASYTPYMIAKAETALRWDRPKGPDGMNGLDRSIYKFLDGVFRLNLGEMGSGFSDMRREIIRPPSTRQIEAQKQYVYESTNSSNNKVEDDNRPDSTVSEVQEDTRGTLKTGANAAFKSDAAYASRLSSAHHLRLNDSPPEAGITIH